MFLFCLLLLISLGYELPISKEKYVTYNWKIEGCYQVPCNLTIVKNNITYLEKKFTSTTYYTLPWYVFNYNPCDKYEWFIASNDTIPTKLYILNMTVYYATSVLKSYSEFINDYRTQYIVIEIPHYTDNLLNSCLKMSIKLPKLSKSDYHAYIKSFKISIDDSYILADFVLDYKESTGRYYDNYYFKSNLVIGCTYPNQKGVFDIHPGRKYLMEVISDWGFSYNVELIIDTTVNPPNAYVVPIIILSIILILIIVMFLIYLGYHYYYKIPDSYQVA
jgi:hypothetical protein